LPDSTNPLQDLYRNLSQVVLCRRESLLLTIVTLLCRGHLLIEDVPGLGKTTLARALAGSVKLDFRRLQCTPDLMPSDITGISVYNSDEHKFHFIPGPVFTHVLLADEINRATPRTQSALLEAMAEGTVTIDRETHALPDPFMVIATQNPVEFSGTYPLPEAQLDRFFMRISLGYPDAEQEQRLMLAQQSGHPLDNLKAVLEGESLKKLQSQCERVTLSREMVRYISELVRATRDHPQVRMGASPRGSLALMRASRAMAMLTGKRAVTPETVQALLEPVLAHRLVFREAELLRPDNRAAFWQSLQAGVAVPDYPVASAATTRET
jgi:MoxR-like ATPase